MTDPLVNDPTPQREHLTELIAGLKEKEAMQEIFRMLASGSKPAHVMDCCMQGMRDVGKQFEKGRYFIAALIMAGEIMRRATLLLEPYLPRQTHNRAMGVILLGTILGDIHDLGKNLFALLARCEGYEVVDLGVDVAPERFLAEARKIGPDLVGISCVLSSTLPDLKKAVELLHGELPKGDVNVIIGGSYVDENVFGHVQADHWASDAARGIQNCNSIIAEKKKISGSER
ncbi:MAG: cobalamin-dependent protein [Deltaproteobacteria bacterium]|nr:cobalamin-dependent protein [Deltaproteobacteria bacterium]